MQSLYEQGRVYCTGCHRYKFPHQVHVLPNGRVHCDECNQQVRLRPRTKAKPSRDSRER
jgi:hypothetical protein